MAVMPISLTELNNSTMTLNNSPYKLNDYNKRLTEYGNVILENNKIPKWSDFYRSATDQFENKIGEHEVKKIKLNTNDQRIQNEQ